MSIMKKSERFFNSHDLRTDSNTKIVRKGISDTLILSDFVLYIQINTEICNVIYMPLLLFGLPKPDSWRLLHILNSLPQSNNFATIVDDRTYLP